jgi:MFS family permease
MSIGLGVFDFAVVVLGYFLGVLADRANKRTLVFFGLLLFAVAGALTGYSFSWLFIIFGFLATTGDEAAGLSLWSWLHALDRDHAHDGLVAGVLTLAEDVGWTVGPILAGFAYWALGPSWAIVLGTTFLFITWLIYFATSHLHIHVPAGSLPPLPARRKHKQ